MAAPGPRHLMLATTLAVVASTSPARAAAGAPDELEAVGPALARGAIQGAIAPLPAPDPEPPPSADPSLGGADRLDGRTITGMIAFTFDDGPRVETTPIVLAALHQYDIPAAFFVVTDRLGNRHGAANRAVLAQVLAAGHLVGSHSATHAVLATASGQKLHREIDLSVARLSGLIGGKVRLFRPPYGALGRAAAHRLRELALTTVTWDIDPRDFAATSAEALRPVVLREILAKNGGVILLHDIKLNTAVMLAGVLDDLERHNCERLAQGRSLITPVSLHYFVRRAGKPVPVPATAEARTANYLRSLPVRCRARADRVARGGEISD